MLKKFEDASDNEEQQRKQRVFVVHGRNEELRKSMFDFLRSIALRPIEWSQAIQMTGETAPFVGDILDAAFLHAQAVVVLLTGDDEARLRPEYHTEKMPEHEKNLTPQSRPNVLFEAGLALGRFPKQTIIVEVGDLRPFSDIAGRHTIRLNNSTRTRQDVAQRLATAGCKVDMSGTDWHQTGNFDIANSHGVQTNPLDASNSIDKENLLSKLPKKTDLAKPKNKSQENDISKVQIDMMLMMTGESGGSSGPVMYVIRDKLKLNTTKFIFMLNELIAKNLIRRTVGSGEIGEFDRFRLTDNGVEFLIGNGYL